MKKFSYLLTIILMLSVSDMVWSQCVTSYTSMSEGDFATGSNWSGGIAPPNPIPPGVTVTMDHEMSNNGTIENNGTLIASVGSFTNNGGATYLGTGTFTGNFINNGTVSPGSTMVLAQLVTAPITAITGTTATSGGSICYDGGSAITAKGVCWSTSPLPTIALPTKTLDGMGTGTFTSSITGLTERTTYYVRAYATNGTGTAYGNEISFTTNCGPVTFTYNGSSVTYGTVLSAGRCWLDRNLGATQVATSSTDAASYGDLFQWGRGADGHQVRNPLSGTINVQSTMDSPGHDDFITGFSDWRSSGNVNLWQGVNGVNNQCPVGYRLPIFNEWDIERLSWGSLDDIGAFASPLKLPLAGARSFLGSVVDANTAAGYWSSTVDGTSSQGIGFSSLGAGLAVISRVVGFSVRCIKDDGPVGAIGGIDCPGATITGTLTEGVAASGVSISVPYTDGNGGSHAGQTVTSTGVTGLTAYVYPGVFTSSAGSLIYTITGTPASAGIASFALNIGGQTCALVMNVGCGSVTFTYNGNSVTYGTVGSTGGKCWLDRNLGATQVATSSTDADSYGDLFQWGRGADGHQVIIPLSGTTGTQSSMDSPGHDDFILGFFDWRSPQNYDLWQGVNGTNNPCPSGYRLPTEAELNAERLSWSSNNAVGAFASPLKLPMAGFREYGIGFLSNVGTEGWYWGSTVSGTNPRSLYFTSSDAIMYTDDPAYGVPVRCLKDDSPVGAIGSLDCDGATNTGTLTSGVAASGVSSSVPYMGGNGGSHAGQTVTSTGVTGLTAYLYPGVFASGDGSLVYTITGTPASSGTASFALNIGTRMCILEIPVASNFICGTSTVTFTYNGSTVTYGTVERAYGGTVGTKCWLDRNLGATAVTATARSAYGDDAAYIAAESASFGDLFQWGRGADGHQVRSPLSGTIATQSTMDSPGHDDFIIGFSDWRSDNNNDRWNANPIVNNPCPSGYRVPTEDELEAERASWSPDNNATGAFASPLKFPMAGYRNDGGSLVFVGGVSYYWTSTVSSTQSRFLFFDSSNASSVSFNRAFGFSVRCIKN